MSRQGVIDQPDDLVARLSDVSSAAGALRDAVRAVDCLIATRLAGIGISFQHARALYHIEHLGAGTVGRLAAALDLSSSVTRLIDTLERAGWLCRDRDERDRRVINILLTEEGRRIVGCAMPIAADAWRDVFALMAEQESEALTAGLAMVRMAALGLMADGGSAKS